MHITRSEANKAWPVPRKGTKYLVAPSHNPKSGVPILILLRELLKIIKTRKELKRILLGKKVFVNEKMIREDNSTVSLFDTISLKDIKKHYRLTYSDKGKMILAEINEKEANSKICKVINKIMLKGKKIQINFNDGRNVLSKDKIRVGDSVIINFSSGKIEKILPAREKAKIMVIMGKHIGKIGEIEKVDEREIVCKIDKKEIKIKLNEIIILD